MNKPMIKRHSEEDRIMPKISVKDAMVNVFLEINGEIYLVAMKKDRLETIQALVHSSADAVIPTGKTQGQLNDFLNYKGD